MSQTTGETSARSFRIAQSSSVSRTSGPSGARRRLRARRGRRRAKVRRECPEQILRHREVVLRTDVTGRQWGVVDELFHIGFVGIVDDNKMVERPRLGAENLQGFGQQFTPLVRDDDTDDFLGCAHGGVLSRSVSLMTWRTCSAASSPS